MEGDPTAIPDIKPEKSEVPVEKEDCDQPPMCNQSKEIDLKEDEKMLPDPTNTTGLVPLSIKIEPVSISVDKLLNSTEEGSSKVLGDKDVCGACGSKGPNVILGNGDLVDQLSPHGIVVKQSDEEETFWIACDECTYWFHGRCVGVEEYQDALIESFHCEKCQVEHGPTKFKQVVAPHRIRFDDSSQIDLPVEIGTKIWIEKFLERESLIPEIDSGHCSVFEDGLIFMDEFDKESEWKKIFLIKQKRGLDMIIPEEGFTSENLVEIFGGSYIVDTIDVYRQTTVPMSVGAFHSKMVSPDRTRLYNFLSLEFTKNDKMRDLVAPPLLVHMLSFVHKFWPDHRDVINWGPEFDYIDPSLDANNEFAVHEGHLKVRPDVALFCLCGMAGSYTDWHIDFGGSSVWYHIYKGEKVFYVAPPTSENLRIYEEHQKTENRSETWLGDLLTPGSVRRVVIRQGQTLMIPSGWLHAVLTPVDSLVFGGNFLHALNVPMQMQIYSMEQRIRDVTGLDDKFMFPQFELVNWYAAQSYVELALRSACEDREVVKPYLLDAAQSLLRNMSSWRDRDMQKVDFDKKVISNQNDVLNHLARNIRDQLKMMTPKRKGKKSRKRQSTDGDDDDVGYTPKGVKVKISVRSPSSSATPSIEVTSPVAGRTRSRPNTPEEPQGEGPSAPPSTPAVRPLDDPNEEIEKFSVRLTKKGDKYSSELLEKPPAFIDGVSLAPMFAGRSSSGRARKPAQWVLNMAGEDIEKEEMKMEEEGLMPAPRVPITDPSLLDEIAAREEKEMEGTEKKSRKKDINGKTKVPALPSEDISSKKKPVAAATPKQRLARKMKLK